MLCYKEENHEAWKLLRDFLLRRIVSKIEDTMIFFINSIGGIRDEAI
ncbi:hypothetical protein SAMN04487897_11195 [Paenibacillus sp. yr247]|nr:hypothetical protein SAMN04487897_11195 [Paenibacillus sp. yr247]